MRKKNTKISESKDSFYTCVTFDCRISVVEFLCFSTPENWLYATKQYPIELVLLSEGSDKAMSAVGRSLLVTFLLDAAIQVAFYIPSAIWKTEKLYG